MTATQQPPTSQPGQQLSGQQAITQQAVIRQPAEPPQSPGQQAAPGQSPSRLSLRAAGARLAGSGTGGTPAVLRSLLTGLVAAGLVWGVFAAWTVNQHASAASQVGSTSEPLTLAAQGMYHTLSDADVTVTTAYLSGSSVPLGVRRHYEADIAMASADLATLHSASGSASLQFKASLTSVSVWLPIYNEFVGKAQAYNSAGHQPTGGSFMQVASEVMHLKLLPAANSLYAQESAALGSVSAQATGLPWIVVALVFAAAIGVALLLTQRWLHRRTHRRVNYGLAWASAAVIVIIAWLAIAFTSARSDLENGLRHGSTPAQELAQASTSAQQARGDEVLNVISRTGSTSFMADFTAMRDMIGPGPGPGTQLALAAAASSGQGATDVATAERDAQSWYAVTEPVFSATNYAGETERVLGKQRGSSYAQFNKLQADLQQAIKADQGTFTSSATAGSDAFGGLEFGVILAALVMIGGSAWGLSRRLAEYR